MTRAVPTGVTSDESVATSSPARTEPRSASWALDDQDAEILTKRVHEMPTDRYGPLFDADLEQLKSRYEQ
ncbi:hypothetical protein ACWDBF_14005 [Streptomyces angustmyceticus]